MLIRSGAILLVVCLAAVLAAGCAKSGPPRAPTAEDFKALQDAIGIGKRADAHETVRRLLKECQPRLLVNGRTTSGNPMLSESILYGETEIATMLIENGADVNAKSNTHLTPLTQARQQGFRDIAAALESAGAKP